jgi:hypothetical protein
VARAYSTPAQFMDAYDTYQYRDDRNNHYSDSNDDKGWQRVLMR